MASSCQAVFFSDVCKRYGSVLYDLPAEVGKELSVFLEWAQASGCWTLLQEPSLSPRIHKQFFLLFLQQSECSSLTLKVLSVLSANKRLGLLPQFLCYLSYLKEPCKIVTLRTSKHLPKKSLAQLTRRLQQWWNIPVEIRQFEDPQLFLGGVFLWDYFMIDVSLRPLLTHLRNKKDYVTSSS